MSGPAVCNMTFTFPTTSLLKTWHITQSEHKSACDITVEPPPVVGVRDYRSREEPGICSWREHVQLQGKDSIAFARGPGVLAGLRMQAAGPDSSSIFIIRRPSRQLCSETQAFLDTGKQSIHHTQGEAGSISLHGCATTDPFFKLKTFRPR